MWYIARVMNSQNTLNNRPDRTAMLRVRCSGELKRRIARAAALAEKDLSDLIRDWLSSGVAQFEQRARAQ